MKQRTEVFIAFTKNSNILELENTLTAWDTKDYEPVGIQVQAHAFDKLRLVAAEGMARGDYILADLGSSPNSPKGWLRYKKGSMRVEAVNQECPTSQ